MWYRGRELGNDVALQYPAAWVIHFDVLATMILWTDPQSQLGTSSMHAHTQMGLRRRCRC